MDLPDPGIEPGSPAMQADSLPTELSGNESSLKYHFSAIAPDPLGEPIKPHNHEI